MDPMMTVDTFYEAMHAFLKPSSSSPSGIITTTDDHSKLQKASLQIRSVITLTSCKSQDSLFRTLKKKEKKKNHPTNQTFSHNEKTSKFSQPTAANKIMRKLHPKQSAPRSQKKAPRLNTAPCIATYAIPIL